MSGQVRQLLPYAIAGIVLMIVLSVGLRVVFGAVAPNLQSWATTLAWIITSVVAIAWYATRAKDEEPPGV